MSLTRGQRLRRLREQKGVEQREAAAAMGISRSYLSLLERDEKGRNVDHLRTTFEKAAAYYGVFPEYLLAETPQEYIAAFVRSVGSGGSYSSGRRLAMVLEELELRWGEEFALPRVADAMGASAATLEDFLLDRVKMTRSVAEQVSGLTGAPADWLMARPPSILDREPELQRLLKMALDSGVQPGELEQLIKIWLSSRDTKTPSGM
ncbi:MAG: helix-turn-helix domain-containing protein [Bacteroidota bacterium]